jgi:hypothetical protein
MDRTEQNRKKEKTSSSINPFHAELSSEIFILLLLLQGYRPQACFRLQENASSHLAIGRPIFRYPLGL